MLTVLLGLTGALSYGAADFLGGLASKRFSAIAVTAGVAVVGIFALFASSFFIEGNWSAESWFWGIVSGVTGAAAIGLLYACLAIGPMSILSPTTAFLSAVVPVSWGLTTGSELTPWLYPALGLAMVAVILVGIVPDQRAVRPTAKGLAMAVASGILIGLFFIFIDQTPADSGVTPLIANRLAQGAILALVIAGLWWWSRRQGSPFTLFGQPGERAKTLPVILGAGILDALANVAVIVGLRVGDLTIVSVLTALYPAGTILLAAAVLRERVAKIQILGLVLALIASAMLAS
jgi:drug/metabolite transporter (DMT)-like permease